LEPEAMLRYQLSEPSPPWSTLLVGEQQMTVNASISQSPCAALSRRVLEFRRSRCLSGVLCPVAAGQNPVLVHPKTASFTGKAAYSIPSHVGGGAARVSAQCRRRRLRHRPIRHPQPRRATGCRNRPVRSGWPPAAGALAEWRSPMLGLRCLQITARSRPKDVRNSTPTASRKQNSPKLL